MMDFDGPQPGHGREAAPGKGEMQLGGQTSEGEVLRGVVGAADNGEKGLKGLKGLGTGVHCG